MFVVFKINNLIKTLKCHRYTLIRMVSSHITKEDELNSSQGNINTKRQLNVNENLAAVLYGANDLRLERREIPKLNVNDVLLAMNCVGVCEDDVQLYMNGSKGTMNLDQPIVIGHEGSGIVLKTGLEVANLEIGDRVAIEPGQPCRNCQQCRMGRYNLCSSIKFCGMPPNFDGLLTHYYKHDANLCFKLPKHVSMEEGALLQSLAQCVAICRRTKIGLGSELVIIGCNMIAIATLLVAQYMGAAKLFMIDKHIECLERAQIYGAKTFQIFDNCEAEHLIERIREYTSDNLPDKCIDFISSDSTLNLAIQLTRPGGVCTIPHNRFNDHVEIPLRLAIEKEVDILGVHYYCNDYPLALAIMSSGKLNLESLITHHFNMDELLLAYQIAQEYYNNSYQKIMIHVQPKK